MSVSSLLNSLPTFGAKTLEGLDTTNLSEAQRVKGSTRQFVRFYNKTMSEVYATKVKINEKTGATTVLETASRPVTREFVEIITPGDKNTIDTHAEDYHKREHFQEYQAFREGRATPIGKSIDECSYISAPIATELRILGVRTEEQLADASEVLLARLPDGFSLQQFARESVKANQMNQNNPGMVALQAELAKAMRMIADLSEKQAAADGAEPAKLEEGPSEAVPEERAKRKYVKKNKDGINETF